MQKSSWFGILENSISKTVERVSFGYFITYLKYRVLSNKECGTHHLLRPSPRGSWLHSNIKKVFSSPELKNSPLNAGFAKSVYLQNFSFFFPKDNLSVVLNTLVAHLCQYHDLETAWHVLVCRASENRKLNKMRACSCWQADAPMTNLTLIDKLEWIQQSKKQG